MLKKLQRSWREMQKETEIKSDTVSGLHR